MVVVEKVMNCKKLIFFIIIVPIHAVVGVASALLSFLTIFNMCGPAHPVTPLTNTSATITLVFLYPFGRLGLGIAEHYDSM